MTKDEFTDLVGIEYADEYEKAKLSQEGTTKDATSDTISRQAAIDAIIEDKICDDSLKIMAAMGSGDKAETLNMTCDRHVKMLMSLPSAQPEPERTMEEFMYGQDMGNPEDGSL